MNVVVEVIYTFNLQAEDEHSAETIADNSIPFIVTNPQTGERINPEIEAYEKR